MEGVGKLDNTEHSLGQCASELDLASGPVGMGFGQQVINRRRVGVISVTCQIWVVGTQRLGWNQSCKRRAISQDFSHVTGRTWEFLGGLA